MKFWSSSIVTLGTRFFSKLMLFLQAHELLLLELYHYKNRKIYIIKNALPTFLKKLHVRFSYQLDFFCYLNPVTISKNVLYF